MSEKNMTGAKKGIYSPQNIEFRELLIQARKALNLSQVQLAVVLGRPQSFVSKYERGERRLDVVEFLEVAQALKIDPLKIIKKLLPVMENSKQDKTK